jgi:hypothetical protein
VYQLVDRLTTERTARRRVRTINPLVLDFYRSDLSRFQVESIELSISERAAEEQVSFGAFILSEWFQATFTLCFFYCILYSS